MPIATLTILSDNTATPPLEPEHGFAVWLATPTAKILFDTGAGPAMLRNAEALGVDISEADAVVLSHGHYDHTGNLAEVLRRATRAKLFAHPGVTRPRFSIHDAPKSIGMPRDAREAVLAMGGARRQWVMRPTEIDAGVWLTGPVPRETDFEDAGGPFYLDAEGREPDVIPDDLSLCAGTAGGWVVCLGCCHAGVVNTLQYILRELGGKKILAVIGGMHLRHATSERLERTTTALKVYDIPQFYPSHCTGEAATAFLAQRFPQAVRPGFAGLKIGFNDRRTM